LARQIATPAFDDLELPRWSPDGKRIAFMAKEPDHPYRIYVAPAAGGGVRQAAAGMDNQGAPTWSPDGNWLVYGNVRCQETRACAIHRIELATGRETTVPGSEGLGTARWSPDGRFIGALQPGRNQVDVLDLKTQHWRKLADGINGDDLAWSADSHALYASRPVGDRPAVVRISLKDGKTEAAVDLSDFSKLTGQISTWFAVTPNDSIIFLRNVRSDEIYAMDYRDR
jgi:Tol biopolymer transport system component